MRGKSPPPTASQSLRTRRRLGEDLPSPRALRHWPRPGWNVYWL